MAKKKSDLIKVLVEEYGYAETDIKSKATVAELEAMIKEAEEAKAAEAEVTQEESKEDPVEEEKPADVVPEAANEGKESEVVFEHTQQLGIFSDYIYHVKNKGAKVTVQNQGMGDVYVSTEGLAKSGDKNQRMSFRAVKEFEDVEVLYFISASQPVVTIIEEK